MTRTAAMRTRRRANAGACLRDQRGLSTLEYALLFVVIIVGALALWRKLGTSLAANVEAGQHTLSQTLDSATAANRDPSSSGPGWMAPGPASNSVGSTATGLRARVTSPSGAASQSTAVSTTQPAAAAALGGATSTFARPVEPQARGLLEQAKDYLVNTPGAQYALGVAAGILQGYTPGGFLVPSPYASSKPFELGRGLGQMGAGIADTVAGLGMVGGGGAATGVGALASVTPGSPAGVALVALGVPTIAAGVAVVASGVSATLAGYGTFINAMSMSDAAPPSGGSSGSGNGSPPPAKASANAARGGGTVPERGPFHVDSKGNAIPTPPGGKVTGSPDGRFVQARDAAGNPTGVRLDGPHRPATHPDPRAQQPHGHVPGVSNPDGTPWLPIRQ
jgi:Tfp pilus assembly protein PilV